MKSKYFNTSIIILILILIVISGVFFNTNKALASCGYEAASNPTISFINSPTGTYDNPTSISVNISGERSWFCGFYDPVNQSGTGYIYRMTSLSYVVTNSSGAEVYSYSQPHATTTSPALGTLNNIDVSDVSIWPAGTYTITATVRNDNDVPNPCIENPTYENCQQFPDFYGVIPDGAGYRDTQWNPLVPLTKSGTFTINRCGTTPLSTQCFVDSTGAMSELVTAEECLAYTNGTPALDHCSTNPTCNVISGDRLSCCYEIFSGGASCSSPTMTGTLTGSNCTIASGASSCTTTLSWNVGTPVNVGGSTVTSPYPSAGTIVSPPPSTGTADNGTKTGVVIPYPSRSFFLYNNGDPWLDTLIVNASCISGTTWINGVCSPGTPSIITGSGTTQLAIFDNTSNPGTWVGTSGDCVGGYTQVTWHCSVLGTCDNSHTEGQVTNGASCGVSTPGACSSPQKHYTCLSPLGDTGTNRVSSPSKWTWICPGTNGGAPSPQCSERKGPIFIEN